jgi:hypothetical protein
VANLANAFIDDTAVAARAVEVPLASFDTGASFVSSCAPGIGIATDNAGLDESLWPATDGSGDLNTGSWTLLDQFQDARSAQISQQIGGPGTVPREGNQVFTWDKTQALYTDSGAASSGGAEGTLPDSTVRLWVNPDNVGSPDNSVPDNDAPPVADNSAVLIDLAVGWTSAVPI